MPVAIAPVIAAAGVTGSLAIPGIGSVAYASIAAYGISLGATVGTGLLLQSRQHRSSSDSQITIRQSTPARVRGYGRAKLGGALFYMGANRVLVQGIAFCEGPIDTYEEIWLNDKQLSSGYGALFAFAGYSWGNNVQVDLQLGAIDQAVSPAFAEAGHTWWDGSHQLKGVAYGVLRCYLPSNATKNFSSTYQNGVPALRVVAKLAQIYDPRSGVTAWSDNPALCIRDYLTHADGFMIDASMIDDGTFRGFADLCDESVPNSEADGGTEKRYRFWGTYTYDQAPTDVLKMLLATCDGEIYMTAAGKIGIRGGQWEAPTVTITDEMVLSYEAVQGVDPFDRVNQYRIRYLDATYWGDWQTIEGDPWDDTAAQSAWGTVIPQDFDGTRCASYMQARRLAKIAMHKSQPAWTLTITTNMGALDALGERVVTVILSELSINATFFVQRFEIDGSLQTCTLTLSSLDASAYEWSSDEEADSGAATAPGDLSWTVPAVTGLTLTAIRTAVAGQVSTVQIEASITPPADQSYGLILQISADGGSTWTDMTATDQWAGISSALADNATYEVRAALTSSASIIGAYASATMTLQPVVLGPIASALSQGTAENYGDLGTVTTQDDWGAVTDQAAVIDLGVLA